MTTARNPYSSARSTIRVLKDSFKIYPWQSVAVILSIVISGLAESLSLLTLLPLLTLGMGRLTSATADQEPSRVESLFQDLFAQLGIEPSIGLLLLIMVGAITVKGLASLTTKAYIGVVAADIATDLRMQVIESLMQTSWQYFTQNAAGRFANAISSEAQRASNAFLSAWNMIAALIQIGFFVIASALLSLPILAGGVLSGFVIMILMGWTVKMSRRAGSRETDLMNSLLSKFTDNLSGIKPLKAMGLEKLVLPVLERETNGLKEVQQHQAFSIAAQQTLPEIMVVIVLATGTYAALQYTAVNMAQLAIMALFFSRMVARITQFQKYDQMINNTESAYWSIREAIDGARRAAEPAIEGGAAPLLTQAIRLENVGFSYDTTALFRNFNLIIPARQITALIGPSGCGKTTIADIVAGLVRPQSGRVLIDGQDMASVDLWRWRQRIGYVPQELYLFHDSVMNNLTLGDPAIDEESVRLALKRADAHDFVENLPEGLHTVIGERGSKLSGGQRQRLMIARALVRKPALLILDEATTALDPATERELCATIKGLAGSVTVLAISHQSALKEIADVVIDLSDERNNP
ncbi:MAG: ABC transporter ATP-binding protein [Micavibrio aeruginosavorus]|uniref:ABC transporter ATP-binding protein n=1 Tax=Micavibrio aeruginosavorus TaxID=349221 RepID=A0A7T5R2I3_9BACT|nr:MAG: ABC transporter ATP-binding protein [Micavibrio aeruginosavorus]